MQKIITIVFAIILTFSFLLSQASIVLQNGSSSLSVVEVIDYNCIHCHDQELSMLSLKQRFKQITFKVSPVAILKQSSIAKAAIAYELAINYPKYFADYHLSLLSSGESSESYLLKQFSKGEVKRMINESKRSKAIFNQMEYGKSLLNKYGTGTPLILIFDRKVSKDKPVMVFKGETSFNELERGINHYVRRSY